MFGVKRLGALGVVLAASTTYAGTVVLQPKMGDPALGLTPGQVDRFFLGKTEFNTVLSASEGLGPIFNQQSCASCHAQPVGGSGSISVTRFGMATKDGFDPLAELGGSLLQAQAISAECAEVVPGGANITAHRITPSTLGFGLLEAIPDADISANATTPPSPNVSGVVHMVPTLENPAAPLRVGRFGWKAQLASVLSFSGDASLNEMGLTNRIVGQENAPNGNQALLAQCDTVPDPEDGPDAEGFHFIDRVTDFQRFLAAPPQTPRSGMSGETIFNQIGCADCHVSSFTTVSTSPVQAQAFDAPGWTIQEPGSGMVTVNSATEITVEGDDDGPALDTFTSLGRMMVAPSPGGAEAYLHFTLDFYDSVEDNGNWDYPAVKIGTTVYQLLANGTIDEADLNTPIGLEPLAPVGAINNGNPTATPIVYEINLGPNYRSPFAVSFGVVSHDGLEGSGIAVFLDAGIESRLEDALRGKTIKPYSDFLLHDMGLNADFIEQGGAGEREIRTMPLWGLRIRDPLWHSGEIAGGTFADRVIAAIGLHDGLLAETGARQSAQAFAALSATDRDKVLAFLDSLGRREFDHDGNNVIDELDFPMFLSCYHGSQGYNADHPCAISDVDQDGDVDDEDLALFLTVYQGANGDCNENSIPDLVDLVDGTSTDCNLNVIPDECEPAWIDVPAFVAAVLADTPSPIQVCLYDTDDSATLNGLDVSGFVVRVLAP